MAAVSGRLGRFRAVSGNKKTSRRGARGCAPGALVELSSGALDDNDREAGHSRIMPQAFDGSPQPGPSSHHPGTPRADIPRRALGGRPRIQFIGAHGQNRLEDRSAAGLFTSRRCCRQPATGWRHARHEHRTSGPLTTKTAPTGHSRGHTGVTNGTVAARPAPADRSRRCLRTSGPFATTPARGRPVRTTKHGANGPFATEPAPTGHSRGHTQQERPTRATSRAQAAHSRPKPHQRVTRATRRA